jgi:uracil-DNA glycosylase family 4
MKQRGVVGLKCKKCEELATSRKQIVLGDGDLDNTQVMVIAEAPGPEEDKVGVPMVGTSGNEARHHITINIPYDMGVYITNVLKCHPPNNRDPKPDEIANCLPRLKAEITDCNPTYIITMGRYATRAILGDVDMEMVHGIPRMWGQMVVIPTYHPAAGLHDPGKMVMFHADMRVAGAVCRGKVLPVEPVDMYAQHEKYELITTPSGVDRYVGHGHGGVVAVDTEWQNQGDPFYIQLSVKLGEAIVVPWDAHGALHRVKQILESDSITTVLHNALFDLPQLAKSDIFPSKTADTMVMAYLLQDEPQALKVLAYRHCGMMMGDYGDVVRKATKHKAFQYLSHAITMEWPDPDPILEWAKGEPKVRQPQNIRKKMDRIYNETISKGADPWKRWHTIKPQDGRGMVEAKLGLMKPGELCDIPQDKAIRYSARDADATIRLYPLLWARIQSMGLEDTFWRDMGAIPIVVDMMANGMGIDSDHFEMLSEYFQTQMDQIELDIAHVAGHPLNPGSHDQCRKLIYDELGLHTGLGHIKAKTGTKQGTGVDILKRMTHPVVDMILDYRSYAKLNNTYAKVIPTMAGEDGRVHTTFRVTRTVTGRLSSSKPNLMAVPVRTEEGRMIRDGYVARAGYSIMSADYCQIEMKVMANDSGDERMLDVFRRKEDIHSKTASWAFGIPEADLDEMKHRYPSKRLGFGVIYGITPMGLHRELTVAGAKGWTVGKCEELMAAWFDMFPKVKEFMRTCVRQARRYGYVRDMWGRTRYIPGIKSPNKWLRLEAERQAGNAPIQMGAQGVIKQAMWELAEGVYEVQGKVKLVKGVYKALGVLPLIQIHDDLVWEVPDSVLGLSAAILSDIMESVTPPDFGLELNVDVKVGKRWGQLHKMEW